MWDSEELMDWQQEAAAIVHDVKAHLKTVEVSQRLESKSSRIYLNATTLEDKNLCICVSAMGFRIVGEEFDTVNPEIEDNSRIYETPYALFTDISPLYVKSFGQALQKAMESIAGNS
ncbi:GSK3-beta interaction protein [Phlebotomus argentipes]|uniref:GSK3-beta interaction protein n=1 Tax=Phlebotomus argentipes TaxID=94469 RepID=UPI00289362EF|nr:GSK3-beta interaction protein [Phlebotomus argentipes]